MPEKYIIIPNRGRYHFDNKMNDLTSTEWLKFQKSWFVLNPKPREDEVMLHPAKFPEELAMEFIEYFTKKQQIVFDPMAGTGSTLVAAVSCNRSAVGIELLQKYASIAEERVQAALSNTNASNERQKTPVENIFAKIHCNDALNLDELDIPEVDYCLTSPPYWDMLHAQGFKTQKSRKKKKLDVYYSDDPRDIGNIKGYDDFLSVLYEIFKKVHIKLKDHGYLTIIVKNVKKRGKIYPLAWDLADRLNGLYQLKDEKIWCQDNQKLAPYGYKNAWVSNTMHHYCLNFRKE